MRLLLVWLSAFALSCTQGAPEADGDVPVPPSDDSPLQCLPALPPGSPCVETRDCRSDLHCIRRRCAPEGLPGEPCDRYGDCVDGAFCETHDHEGRERPDPICRPRIGDGRPCPTATPWSCLRQRCIRGMCRADSPLDGPCGSSSDCEGDAFCELDAPADDGRDGVCRPKLAEGEPCWSLSGCLSGLICDGGRCLPRPEEGANCFETYACDADLYCDRYDALGLPRAQPICAPEKAVGEPCDALESSQCHLSSCLAGRCVRDQPLGAPCERGYHCEPDLRCGAAPAVVEADAGAVGDVGPEVDVGADMALADPCPPPGPGTLVVNEVMVDGLGADLETEFIELVNTSDQEVALGGLSIDYARDGGEPRGAVRFTGGCMPPRGAVALFAEPANWIWEPSPAELPQGMVEAYAFNNSDGFTFTVRQGDALISQLAGAGRLITSGVSATRSPELVGGLVLHDTVPPHDAQSPARCANGGTFAADCLDGDGG